MENILETFLNEELKNLKEKRRSQNQDDLSDNQLLGLIKTRIEWSELYPIMKKFPEYDPTLTLKRIIYIECRMIGLDADEALKETENQMKNIKK